MKTLAKSIAAVAATSAIAVCTLVTAVSASTNAFNSSAQSVTSTEETVPLPQYLYDTTKDIKSYSNFRENLNCKNSFGNTLSSNSVLSKIKSIMTATENYIDNYKWCSILVIDTYGNENYKVSDLMGDKPNQKKIIIQNTGLDGTLQYATFLFCVNDGKYNTSDPLGKTYLDVELKLD